MKMKVYFSISAALILLTLLIDLSIAQQGQSACQQHAARERRLNSPLTLIPECNEDGTYKSTQCHPPSVNGKRFCQCWTPDGSIITSPSQKTKACECHRKRFESLNRNGEMAGASFTPQCNDDGTFREKQCKASTGECWCVHKDTGLRKSVTSSSGGSADLDCVTRTVIGRRG